jgi:Kunitz/Bovine pancreatic trypsin inhibitor domain
MKTLSNRSIWGTTLALLWLAACGGAVGSPTVGGESHFLRHCGDGCGPGLECVSDVCTRGCRVDSGSCSDLAASARCTNESVEPGELAVCDLSCEKPADCRVLGADFECDSGFCRGPARVGQGGSGGGGASGAGTTGGSSGAGTTGGSSSAGGTGGVPVPAARCLLPFEPSSCDAAFPVFAFEDGQCVPKIYGGCEGNDNRFNTVEECWSVCEGRPSVAACPEGRVAQKVCLACGPAGGCATLETVCAQPCGAQEPPCESPLTCDSGFCQMGRCI